MERISPLPIHRCRPGRHLQFQKKVVVLIYQEGRLRRRPSEYDGGDGVLRQNVKKLKEKEKGSSVVILFILHLGDVRLHMMNQTKARPLKHLVDLQPVDQMKKTVIANIAKFGCVDPFSGKTTSKA